MQRRVIAIAGVILLSALGISRILDDSVGVASGAGHRRAITVSPPAAGDEPPESRDLNQQWSGWVFGRMFGASVPTLGPQTPPAPNLFGWK